LVDLFEISLVCGLMATNRYVKFCEDVDHTSTDALQRALI